MCGRFTLHTPQAGILQAFAVESNAVTLLPRYNITPSLDIPVVRAGGDGRELAMARWGLVPGWSKRSASEIFHHQCTRGIRCRETDLSCSLQA